MLGPAPAPMMVVLVLGVEAGVTVVAVLTITVPPLWWPDGTICEELEVVKELVGPPWLAPPPPP